MRLIYYKKEAQDGIVSTHFVNIDRVESFTIHPKGDVTELIAFVGNNVHVLNDKKKIINVSIVISRLLEIGDRAYVDVDKFIDESNNIAKMRK